MPQYYSLSYHTRYMDGANGRGKKTIASRGKSLHSCKVLTLGNIVQTECRTKFI